MPKNTHPDSKSSADKKSLNVGGGKPSPDDRKVDRNQVQETRTVGQFTGRGKPALQKK